MGVVQIFIRLGTADIFLGRSGRKPSLLLPCLILHTARYSHSFNSSSVHDFFFFLEIHAVFNWLGAGKHSTHLPWGRESQVLLSDTLPTMSFPPIRPTSWCFLVLFLCRATYTMAQACVPTPLALPIRNVTLASGVVFSSPSPSLSRASLFCHAGESCLSSLFPRLLSPRKLFHSMLLPAAPICNAFAMRCWSWAPRPH